MCFFRGRFRQFAVRGIGTIALSVCVAEIASSDDTQTMAPEQLLDSFERRLGLVSGARFSFSQEGFQSVGDGSQELNKVIEKHVSVDQTGKRIRVAGSSDVIARADKNENIWHSEHIVRRGTYLLVGRRNGKPPGLTSQVEVPSEEWDRYVSSSSFGPVFGYLPLTQENGWIPAIARSMKLRVRSDELDGVPLLVLEGKSNAFDLGLWLDPALNYAARRITMQRHQRVPNPTIVDRYVYEVEAFEQFGDHYFPAKYHIKSMILSGFLKPPPNDGIVILNISTDKLPRRNVLRRITVEAIELNPEFMDSEFELQTEVPDGTNVFMRDVRHIAYIWNDGKVIVNLNSVAVGHARGANFERGSAQFRFWLIGVNVIVLIAVCCYAAYVRWRKSTKRNDG